MAFAEHASLCAAHARQWCTNECPWSMLALQSCIHLCWLTVACAATSAQDLRGRHALEILCSDVRESSQGVILRSRIEVSWLMMHGVVEGPRLCRVKRQTMNLRAPLKHHM